MSAEILNAQHNDDTFENIWQELKWRGLVHVSTDEAALEKALSEETLTFYTGYDPTAASLHLGPPGAAAGDASSAAGRSQARWAWWGVSPV